MPYDPAPYQGHSDTSMYASWAIAAHAGSLRAQVFTHLCAVGLHGATDEELQRALGMPANTQRPRRVELVRAGVVRDSGRRRPTSTKRNAVVWIATAFDYYDLLK